MGRRTLLLVAALVVAALGTVLVFLYAKNAQDVARAGQELVKVIVAKQQISAGTTGAAALAAGAFEEKQIPRDTLVPGAVSDVAPLGDLVALVTVYTGQQVISQQWGSASQITSLPLPAGKIALSVALNDPERVAGFVSPGSTVAIFATGGPAVRVLLSNITVIGVGNVGLNAVPTSTASDNQVPQALLTLAVTQAEAEKIIFAQGRVADPVYNGLYFALMDKNSKVTAGATGANPTNLFPTPGATP